MVGLTEKLLFLDFDGVITTYKSGWTFDEEKLKLLDIILQETQCQIVISSSWRSSTLEETLESLHFLPFIDKVVGVTPRLELPTKQGDWEFDVPFRGLEVDAYLNSLGKKVNYVILDDDSDFLWTQREHFVRTNSYGGLTMDNVREAINILNKKD